MTLGPCDHCATIPAPFHIKDVSWDMLLLLKELVKLFSVLFHRETGLEGHLVHYHLDVVQGRYSIIPWKGLRTVPTFVSAHTFCASRKAGLSAKRALRLTLSQPTRLPSTRLKWKQNFPTVTKSSLMSLYLNQEHQNSSISLTTNC